MDPHELTELVERIGDLPMDFHDAGVLGKDVLRALHAHTRGLDIRHSVETGSGKSTLLLSWISQHHRAFTLDTLGGQPARSLTAVRESPLFNAANVEFVLGPTQLTLPNQRFDEPLQLAFLDGPHGFPFPQLEYYFLYPHLEEGGLLIIDDIHIPTIAQLNDFVREDAMFEPVATVGATAFHRRTAAPTFDPLGDGWWEQNFNKKRYERLKADYYRQNFATLVHDRLAEHFGENTARRARRLYRAVTMKDRRQGG